MRQFAQPVKGAIFVGLASLVPLFAGVLPKNDLIELVTDGSATRFLKFTQILESREFEKREYSEAMANVCRWAMMGEKIGSPGYLAREENCIKISEILLKRGADINYFHNDDNALTTSAFGRQRIFMRYLLSKKADPNVTDKVGSTPLFRAAASGEIESVRELLKAGAKVQHRSADGHTALHAAARNGSLPIVELLLRSKADLNAKTKEGLTPLQSAQLEGKREVVSMLKKAGAKDFPLPESKSVAAHKPVKTARPEKTAEQRREENYKKHKAKIDMLRAQTKRIGAEIRAVEAELQSIGWTAPQYEKGTVTGYKCDSNNQNCRTTTQGGGGETVSSQWRRINNTERARKLEFKRNDLIHKYDKAAREHDKLLEGRRE